MRNTSYAAVIEIPSGKNQSYENFPVGSFLISKHLRPHITTFYWFARTIDDIADSNAIEPREKLDRLTGFENVILGKDKTSQEFLKAHLMRQSLDETGVTTQHCMDLISAFKQDATKLRYKNWDELINYCQLSAAPVGRYLLDLHGERSNKYGASDALCNALQVLNHLQDCKEDYLNLNRVYLPLDYMTANGLKVESLDAPNCVPELRSVIFQILDLIADLLGQANKLPRGLSNKRLAMEAGAILNIATTLERELRRRDPLAESVKLSKAQYVSGCIIGAFKALLDF